MDLNKLKENLALSPLDHLVARTTTSRKATNAAEIIVIVCLALLAVGLIFCIIVTVIICKNKRARKNRERKLEASKPSQTGYENLNSSDANQHLLYDGNGVPLREMDGGDPFRDQARVDDGRPQQLDSYPAPAKFDAAAPIELPSQVVSNHTRR